MGVQNRPNPLIGSHVVPAYPVSVSIEGTEVTFKVCGQASICARVDARGAES